MDLYSMGCMHCTIRHLTGELSLFKLPQELQLSIASSSATNEPLDAQFCPNCGIPLLPEFKPKQLYIYLHGLRSVPFSFSSELLPLPLTCFCFDG
ncbi:hypothetical protein VP01_3517g4, partial [Puccinia sorghi]